MPIGTKSDGSKFVTIFNGRFEIASKEGEPNAVSRTTKSNKVKWVQHFDFVSGRIIGAKIQESQDYDDQLIITVDDGLEKFKICVGVDMRHFQKFAIVCNNIDLNENVEFSTYSFKDDKGKERRGWTIKQNGENVENYLDRNDVPPGVQNKKGKWNFDEQREFLVEHVNKWIESASFPSSVERKSNSDFGDDDEIDFN